MAKVNLRPYWQCCWVELLSNEAVYKFHKANTVLQRTAMQTHKNSLLKGTPSTFWKTTYKRKKAVLRNKLQWRVQIWKKASSWFEILPNLLLFLTEWFP